MTPTVADQEDNGPGAGPGPQVLSDEALSRLLSGQRFGALATNKRNGHPHVSTVLYGWNPAERVVRISTTADRAKVRQLQRDSRSALYVTSDDFWSFAVAEGEVELSPVSSTPGDETGQELLAMQPPFENAEDKAAFLRQMVADQRLVIRLRVARLYGTALDVPTATPE